MLKSAVPSSRSARIRRFAGVFFLILLAGGIYRYNEYRKVSWGETLSPLYWWRRYHDDDLYDAQNAFLMHGSHALPEVALTFDDGPHRESRSRILDTLKKFGVNATFFDVGERMAESPELLRRTLAEGHEVANHSYAHNRLDSLTPSLRHREINDADITYFRITGQHLSFLRPPGMRYNADVLAMTKRLGYIVVGYNTASRDSDLSETSDFISMRTLRRVENGSIVLLHDYPSTADALPQIIRDLKAQGYRFVTISEMIAHLPAKQRQEAITFYAK